MRIPLLKLDHGELMSLSKHITTVHSLLQFHAVTVTTGNSTNPFIASKLISLYDSFNLPFSSSSSIFLSLPSHSKDTFLWNSFLKSLFSRSLFPQVLSFHSLMRASNLFPNHFTFPIVAASTSHLMNLPFAMYLHALATKLGLFPSTLAVSSSFVSLYSRCGEMKLARVVFDEIPVRDVVAWTALVIGYVHNGECDNALRCVCCMHSIGDDAQKPNFRTFEGGFLACGDLGGLLEGACLHGLVLKNGIGCCHVIRSSLLTMYCKCGVPQEAYQSFCEVIDKDLLSWTSIIGVYARFGMVGECVMFFCEMQEIQVYPDGIVIGCVLSGFSNSMDVYGGKAFHGVIIRSHDVADEVVNNSLLSMYCKFGMLSFAERLFHRCGKNNECWNLMVSGYGRTGENMKCIELFREMQYLGIHTESVSIVSAVASCTQLGATNLGRSIHCNVIKGFIDDNVSVTNSLIDMYGKCGKMTFARRIFNSSARDVISWNSLISSHIHAKHHEEAVALFNKMIIEQEQKPNTATFVVVLSACSHLASLDEGERVHRYINERGFNLNIPLGTALVDMYAKCGQLEKSREVFDSMTEKDVVCWNAMISGYGMNGYAKSAVEIFQHMEESSVKPNEITFLSLLSACAHAGLVQEGKYLFAKMQSYSVKPNLKHYTCMVDLLGRSGNIAEAEALVLSMPISPDGGVWGALLSACKTYNQVEMGIRIAMHAIDSEPENDGYYMMMANLYSSIGRWEEAENVRRTMKERCLQGKKAGWSVL